MPSPSFSSTTTSAEWLAAMPPAAATARARWQAAKTAASHRKQWVDDNRTARNFPSAKTQTAKIYAEEAAALAAYRNGFPEWYAEEGKFAYKPPSSGGGFFGGIARIAVPQQVISVVAKPIQSVVNLAPPAMRISVPTTPKEILKAVVAPVTIAPPVMRVSIPTTPKEVLKVIAAPVAAVAKVTASVTEKVVAKAPTGGLVGKLNVIAATQVSRVATATKQVETGQIGASLKTGAQIVADPGKRTNQDVMEKVKKYPAIAQVVSIVGMFVPVVGLISLAISLQLAMDKRKLLKLQEQAAKADAAELEKINAEIAELQAQIARQEEELKKENAARGMKEGDFPPFTESVAFAWADARNKLGGN